MITRQMIAAALVMLTSGCASITRGTMDSLVVESTPSGAAVSVWRTDREFTSSEVKRNGGSGTAGPLTAQTPASFALKREGEYRVVLEKDGFETVEAKVTHSVAGSGAAGMAGNVLVGGGIGAIVDANTGAMHNLNPNPVSVTLHPR